MNGIFVNTLTAPPLWLLVLIVGLPQLSETVYTPALPDVARTLGVAHYLAEYTLTIYLFGFAIGTLFWGKISDKYGRKPSLLVGLVIYMLGCIGCYHATSFVGFMINRFIQAFGGSTGSVLGQVICRDSFSGSDRGKVFSIIGSALAFSPAIGPVVGGFITQSWQWPTVFVLLSIIGFIVILCSIAKLPETYTYTPFSLKTIQKTAIAMSRDSKVLTAGFIVAACNGITFSYFAEGPFYLVTLLGLSPFLYGLSFVLFTFAGLLGSYISKRSNDQNLSPYFIMQKGIKFVLGGAFIFAAGIIFLIIANIDLRYAIILTLCSMALIMTGIGIIIPNILSVALEEYRTMQGTASSLFGFYYYCLISLFTLIMGLLHNHTLLPMPLFFMAIAGALAVAINYLCVQKISK